MLNTFKPFLQEAWKKSGFQTMASIQEKAIPLILEGKDVIAESPTGTGKTLAYLLPLLQKIEPESSALQAVVLASSQELVMQIFQEFQKWSEGSGIRGTSIIGGANLKRQIEKLKKRPHVIFATPGRLFELIKQKKVKMHEVKMIVLDEGDQLLTKEHLSTVQNIIKSTMGDRQVVLFSATLNSAAEKLAKEITRDSELIRISRDESVSSGGVEHIYFVSERRDKIKLLEKIARLDGSKSLAFINDISELQVLKEKLQYKKLSVAILHSEMNKLERKQALKAFREGKINMLIATDVAARGLDIQGITHVVGIDLPKDLSQYVHRAGRTGRMGASGTVISLVTQREERELKQYCRQLKITPKKRTFYKGQIVKFEEKLKK
ncbi:DEAD/DEAH box helicase [Neobacillus sedimentimangrovi]|jgi:superfamily II DNA/RNA helicase|uniref:DEAD/DEAH box helicase n=2 Tax=Neobacillus TaxID=2675232 RepID=A0A6B3TUB7_9BACI|nr:MULTISPECIES: DEAD/DEAH box helicase [Neobacillus]MCD4838284.1 DEAD/DEAH box helicase [Neobacillus sedimentimangrovi]MED3625205.1 DEAD/DEAH box helicase [Neobacillus thermocopriae]MED3715115.1 DEAD/DEAH box helicase [Neobacillus thermocopriae]NEX80038.1 DEAD/DEAH box helicase [Neobacillus thermocopriae]